MRIDAAERAILVSLPLGCEEIEGNPVLSRFTVDEINAAATSLLARGEVIAGYETEGRLDYDFSFLTGA